jgi:hypothetical protein
MTFRIGQKVVCIKSLTPSLDCRNVPHKGAVYTVRGFSDDCTYRPDETAIYLEEIVNQPFYYERYGWYGEPSFMAFRFRPVVERKTDAGMAILRKLLKTKPTKAPADLVTTGKQE